MVKRKPGLEDISSTKKQASLILRTNPAIHRIFKPLNFLTAPMIFLDNFFSDAESKVKNFEEVTKQVLKRKETEVKFVLVFVSDCTLNLSVREKLFLDEIMTCGLLLHVVNCNKHEIHKSAKKSVIVERQNVGRDLAAYRDSLNLLSECKLSLPVVLFNSSCYWDSDRMMQFFEATKGSENEILFMTKSFQRTEHFQTFFIYVPECYLNWSRQMFESNIRNWSYKRSIVQRGEYVISGKIQQDKIRARDIYPWASFGIAREKWNFLNPSIYLARQLIERGAPFIKKSYLKI